MGKAVKKTVPLSKLCNMRRFQLVRSEDESGVSGTGVVAEGVQFSNGKIAYRFLSQHGIESFADTMINVEAIHGHEGKTKVVWIDKERNHEKST